MDNPFYLEKSQYKRDYDVIGNAKQTISQYIHLHCPQFSKEECEKYVAKRLDSDVKLYSPKMKVLRREPRGDRERSSIDFLSYIAWVDKNNHGLAPNMVCYSNPEIERSYLSDFIDLKLKSRKIKKKLAHTAKMEGNTQVAIYYNLAQNNDKIAINSLSGALSVPYNFVYLGSGHSSLTSICRAVTSYANAINEKFLAGSKNYYNAEVTKEDLAFLSRRINMVRLADVVEKYGMEAPTVEETCEHVFESTRRYWYGPEEGNIRKMIQGMTPLERIAVTYVGDLRGLGKYDDTTLRGLYSRLLKDVKPLTIDEADEVMKTADADQVAFNGVLCIDFMKGIKVDDLKSLYPELYVIYTARLKNIRETFVEYKDFIQVFFAMDYLPGQIHSITSILRQAVPASDTDSDIFTSGYQIEWYCGNIGNEWKHTAVSAITIYLSSQIIAHSLGTLCANMGVGEENIFRLTMKNEFYFPLMLVTTRTKHYAALQAAIEGAVLPESKLELKGVALRGSKIARAVAQDSEVFFKGILDYTLDNLGTMSPLSVMAIPAYIEHRILPALLAGEVWALNAARVNKEEGYKNPLASDFFQSLQWNAIFGAKYGKVELLPAQFVKVPVILDTKKKIETWVESLTGEMKVNAKEFFLKHPKNGLTNIFVPVELLEDGKIPVEIIPLIATRRHIAQVMQRFYLFLEGYGIQMSEPKNLTLFHDMMTLEECFEFAPTSLKDLAVNSATGLTLDYLDDYYLEDEEDEDESDD